MMRMCFEELYDLCCHFVSLRFTYFQIKYIHISTLFVQSDLFTGVSIRLAPHNPGLLSQSPRNHKLLHKWERQGGIRTVISCQHHRQISAPEPLLI